MGDLLLLSLTYCVAKDLFCEMENIFNILLIRTLLALPVLSISYAIKPMVMQYNCTIIFCVYSFSVYFFS